MENLIVLIPINAITINGLVYFGQLHVIIVYDVIA